MSRPLSVAVAWAVLSVVFSEGRAAPEGCLDLGGLPGSVLSPEDQRFLDDFGTALRRFRGLSVDELLAELGPGKEYRTAASSPAIFFLRGDTGGDGRLDLADAVCTLGHLFLGSGPCLYPLEEDALDTDDSGTVDITDPIYALEHLFTGGPAPPAPFPAAGEDPTLDDLRSSSQGVGKLGYDPLEAEYLPLITGKLGPLSEQQEVAYRENGFVILRDRTHQSFFDALGAVHANDLPVYVSADTVLDALHLSFDEILKAIEEELLIGELDAMLSKLDAGIPALEKYSGGHDIGRDLDHVAFWVATARSLLSGERAPSRRPGADPLIDEFLGYVAEEAPHAIRLFGIDMASLGEPFEDFSQFKPRSHYTDTEELQRYFRAMMWVQRIGARFAQCNAHAAVAFLLARDLVDSGAVEHWSRIDAVVKALVGTSDSLNATGMAAFAESAGMESVASLYDEIAFAEFSRAALSGGAGRQLINSQVLMANPSTVDGFTPLPPLFHVMGQRFIVDSFVFTNVVHDRVPERDLPSPLDAWFVLANRATLPLLEGELRTYDYASNLAAMDWIVSRYPESFWSASLYNVWLSALRSLDEDTTGSRYPPVMQTREWERKTLNTQLGSWAQLRHDTLLYAKQSYTVDECEYPEGWVDPYPRFFATLAAFAEKLRSELGGLGVSDLPSGERIALYAANLASHSRMLESIAHAELDGVDLTTEQRTFLKSTMKRIPEELRPLGSGSWPYNGWYPEIVYDLNPPRGLPWPAFKPVVADVHTCMGPGCGVKILHTGVGAPELMLISIQNACGTKAYVGPVFSYYEFVGDSRWTDGEWLRRLRDTTKEQPPRPDWLDAVAR